MADFPLITTKEFSARVRVEPDTIRRSYCVNGHYLGLIPIKLDNGRLLWPENDVDGVLSHGNQPRCKGGLRQ